MITAQKKIVRKRLR